MFAGGFLDVPRRNFGAVFGVLGGLDDPRSGNAVVHDFYELLLTALCAVLCGGQGAVDMALLAKAKEPFLRSFLKMGNGPPSHDPFSRLFRSLDPQQFGASFQRFMEEFSEGCQGVVAIDGKVLRRSFDRAGGKSPCIWSAPGAASSGWCWPRSPPMPSPTRSPRCRSCWDAGAEGSTWS
jgi:hypothetical protein